MSASLADLACTVPWCITPAAFEAMLSIAEREPLPAEQIAEAMHGPKALALRNGKRRDDSGRMTMQGSVALIPVDGPIYRYADYFTKVSGGVTTEQLARDFQAALDDTAVEAILFVFDSPGGEGMGINELADTIYTARGRKPIVAYVESQAASAAYWIATAADEIVMDDTALVGSIGTIISVPDPAKRFSRSIDFVSSTSPRKRPDPTTEGGRADIQALADSLNEVFIAKVARNMGVSVETVLSDFGQGGQFVGQQAIAAGMAHRLGSEDRLLRELSQRAARRPLPGRLPGVFPITAKEDSMRVSEIVSGVLRGFKAEGIEIEPDEVATAQAATESTTTAVAAAAPSADQDTQAARLAELEQQLAEQRTAQIAQSAATFADGAIRDRRAYPAERAALVAAYTQAAQDDARSPLSEPGAATQSSRVALLEGQLAARPQHSLSSELIASGQGGVLEANAGPKPMSAERRRQLLAMTPLGQAVLARERAKSA